MIRSDIPSSFRNKTFGLKIISCAGLLSLIAGCADRPPETFPKPDYSYLPQMNLNVADLNYSNQAEPQKGSLADKSPTRPDESLDLMARQRLHASGNTGIGTFTIHEARISAPSDDVLVGTMSVHLTLKDPAHGRHAAVTAQVTHQDNISGNYSRKHELYELNRHLMDDMNVELEYQIRRHMGDWLTDATGAPLNATVQAQSLDSLKSQIVDPTARPEPPPPSPSTAKSTAASSPNDPLGLTSSGSSTPATAPSHAAPSPSNDPLDLTSSGSSRSSTPAPAPQTETHSPPPSVLTLPE